MNIYQIGLNSLSYNYLMKLYPTKEEKFKAMISDILRTPKNSGKLTNEAMSLSQPTTLKEDISQDEESKSINISELKAKEVKENQALIELKGTHDKIMELEKKNKECLI